MICASIISCYLNVPLIDVNGFINGLNPSGGDRLKFFNKINSNKILVVDDSIWMGNAMKNVKQQLSKLNNYEFIYLCVYLEGPAIDVIDIFLEDVRHFSNNFSESILHEWNIFQHHDHLMSKWMFDIDGVFCLDPPNDHYEEEYVNYIKSPIILFTPRAHIGAIVTYRISKYKDITQKFLSDNNINYNELIMFNSDSTLKRDVSGISPGRFKGEIYKSNDYYNLFIESDDDQAREISNISKKQVFCVKTNKMY